jgi:carboxylesterase
MLELRWLVRRVKEEIGAVRQPALIVHPREDDRASLRNLHYLQTSLGGLTETVVLDDSYHLVTLDRQRQIVVARTLEFAHRLHQGVLRTLADDAEDPMADARCEQRRES